MIALCEDDEKDRKLILDMLEEWGQRTGQRCEIRCFSDAAALLDVMLTDELSPDLILMDIYFNGQSLTGIDAVTELRKVGLETEVVFLTTSREHALAAFDLEARQYLVKPVERGRLFRVLDQCGRQQPRSLLVKQHGGVTRRVFCNDILYCETQKNDQVIHLTTGEVISTRASSAKMRDALCATAGFVNLGPSYIINLLHVVSMENDSISLEGGKRLSFSHKRFLEFRSKYFDFFSD